MRGQGAINPLRTDAARNRKTILLPHSLDAFVSRAYADLRHHPKPCRLPGSYHTQPNLPLESSVDAVLSHFCPLSVRTCGTILCDAQFLCLGATFSYLSLPNARCIQLRPPSGPRAEAQALPRPVLAVSQFPLRKFFFAASGVCADAKYHDPP